MRKRCEDVRTFFTEREVTPIFENRNWVVSSQQVLWFVLGLDVFKPEQFICSIFEMKIFKTGTANI